MNESFGSGDFTVSAGFESGVNEGIEFGAKGDGRVVAPPNEGAASVGAGVEDSLTSGLLLVSFFTFV